MTVPATIPAACGSTSSGSTQQPAGTLPGVPAALFCRDETDESMAVGCGYMFVSPVKKVDGTGHSMMSVVCGEADYNKEMHRCKACTDFILTLAPDVRHLMKPYSDWIKAKKPVFGTFEDFKKQFVDVGRLA